jgi:hypothetical protein
MHYATHCVGPCLALTGKSAEWVSCLGSGRVQEQYARHYGSPFAIETTHIKLKDSDVHAEITRSLYNTAREYVESFDVYGSLRTFEWSQLAAEDPVIFTGEEGKRARFPTSQTAARADSTLHDLRCSYDLEERPHVVRSGAGHWGSHLTW